MTENENLRQLLIEARKYLEPAGHCCSHESCGANKKRVLLAQIDSVLAEPQTPERSKISWFARGGDIAKMGPFKSQVEATNALRLATDCDRFPEDAFVWPEET